MNTEIQKLISEYISCSKVCEQTDYENDSSIKKHNQSADRMYEIVEEIKSFGDNAISQLAELLNHPVSSKWLAHQLIEKSSINDELRQKCINIIRQLAKENTPNGFGEKMWLKERGISLI
jgi:hypothetical protein